MTPKKSKGIIANLANQNPLLGLEVDYLNKLSPSELEWLANFTLRSCGSREHCDSESERKENTSRRGKFQRETKRERLNADSLTDLASPTPSPEIILLYLEAKNQK